MTVEVYFDGGTKGNRVCVVVAKTAKVTKVEKNQTNNQLEYHALILALRSIHTKNSNRVVNVIGDSLLIINQMKGKNAVKSLKLIDLYEQAKGWECVLSDKKITLLFYWVPREENLAGIELDKNV